MELRKKTLIIGAAATALTAAILLAISSDKTAATPATQQPSPPPIDVSSEPSVTKSTLTYAQEAEQKRQQFLEEKAIKDNLAKKQTSRVNSLECQFWKQQKTAKKNAKADAKIAQYCNI